VGTESAQAKRPATINRASVRDAFIGSLPGVRGPQRGAPQQALRQEALQQEGALQQEALQEGALQQEALQQEGALQQEALAQEALAQPPEPHPRTSRSPWPDPVARRHRRQPSRWRTLGLPAG